VKRCVEGESETVEFKAWLPVDREKPKSYECECQRVSTTLRLEAMP